MRRGRLTAILLITPMLASCDPTIFFIEEESNVSVSLQVDGQARVAYWEEGSDGVPPYGGRLVREVAATLFPHAWVGGVVAEGDRVVATVRDAWETSETSTLIFDVGPPYGSVAATSGSTDQWFLICYPSGVRASFEADQIADDEWEGCAGWRILSQAEAPTIVARSRPALVSAWVSLILAVGALITVGIGWTWWARHRRFRKAMLVPVAVVPIAVNVLLLWFAGDIQAFSLVGQDLLTGVAGAAFAGLMATAGLGFVVAVWALVTHPWTPA